MVLPRTSEGLYLLQRVRDEAHRFAIALHRPRRSKSMTSQRPRRGARPRRDPTEGAAQALRLAQAAAAATVEEIAEVPGIGPRTAEAIVAALAARGRVPAAVNTATGEILDDGAGVDDGEST